MSLQADLNRNRAAFLRLSTGGAETVESFPVAPTGGYEEGGFVPEEQFRHSVRQIQGEAFTPAALPEVSSGQEGFTAPAGGTTQADNPKPQPRVYRLGSIGAEPAVTPVTYPDLPQQAGEETQDDLLETLVRRMEAGARRYPQEIGQEGGASW